MEGRALHALTSTRAVMRKQSPVTDQSPTHKQRSRLMFLWLMQLECSPQSLPSGKQPALPIPHMSGTYQQLQSLELLCNARMADISGCCSSLGESSADADQGPGMCMGVAVA